MLLATLSFTVMQATVKGLAGFHVFQLVFFRSVVTAALCTAILASSGVPLLGRRRRLLVGRAICGIVSMTLFFVTLQRMPLGASLAVKYTSPVFTAAFAVLLLRERVSAPQWLCYAAACAGVLLVRGFDNRVDATVLALGLLGAFFGGLVYVIIRRIGEREHPLVIVNYFMTLSALWSGLAMVPAWRWPTPLEWAGLLLVGGSGYVAQVSMTRAFQLQAASEVAPIKYAEVVYSLLIGWLWFGEGYSAAALCGIALVVASMLLSVRLARGRRPAA